MTDSIINLFYNPILWTENNEISGNYIQIHLRKNQINQMDVFDSGWIVQEEAPGHFNQIKGDTLLNYFKDNKLKNVLVYPNAESIYYAKENDTAYTGINVISCQRMKIELDSQQVKRIKFYDKPQAKLYPLNKIPAEEKKLEGFRVLTERKPLFSMFEQREKSWRAKSIKD